MRRESFLTGRGGRGLAAALALATGTGVAAPAAFAASRPEGGAAELERVSFPSLDGDRNGGPPTRIEGALFRPSGPGPFAAVVALHGCGGLWNGSRLTSRHQEWAARLRDQGLVVLFPDSFTPRGVKGGICQLKDRAIHPTGQRRRDAYGALRFLQSLPFVRPDRVGLLGWSNGGSTVLAAVDSRLAWRPADRQRDFRVAVAFYPGCRVSLERPGWKPSLPLSIFIGARDDWTPAEPCVKLGERTRALGLALEVVTYPGAYHDFDAPGVPLHVRTGVATTPSGQATVGTDPEARRDAMERTLAIFRTSLRPPERPPLAPVMDPHS